MQSFIFYLNTSKQTKRGKRVENEKEKNLDADLPFVE